MRYDWVDYFLFFVIGSMCLILLAWIIYGIAWICTPYGPNFTVMATVKSISYSPSSSSTGMGISGNGSPVVTTSYISEEYVVVLKTQSGRLWMLNHQGLFKNVDTGQKLAATVRTKAVFGDDTDNWDLVSWEILK